MSEQVVKLVVAGALLVHGLGHGGAVGTLAWISRQHGKNTGDWRAARSYLVPSLAPPAAALLASTIWVLAMSGFVLAAVSLSSVLLPTALWRPLAIGSAVVSLLGITLFIGTWPILNTLAALSMNVAVLVALVFLGWPPPVMLQS